MKLSTVKYILIFLAAINAKAWPGAWHARFYFYLFKHFVWRRSIKEKDLFASNSYTTHTPLMEIDANMHKNNATYFSDLDLARADLLMATFKDFFKHYKYKKGDWPFCPLGSVLTIFKKEIRIYQPYTIRSRVLGWDNKWIFILSRFEFKDKNRTLAAVSLSKYVFKFHRKTIPPEEAVKHAGYGSEENLQRGRMDFEKAKAMLEIESIQEHF